MTESKRGPGRPKKVVEETPKGRGRPKGTKDSRKVKLKASPTTAKEDYYKKYGELGTVAIYGADDFTEALVDYLWTKPDITSFVMTDPIESKLTRVNRNIGNRAYSMYRWEIVHHQGFIEDGYFPVVVVAKEYYDTVKKLPNPYNVKLVVLEEL